jgi:hypothetical protein
MGGAFIAVADDGTAATFNPAGLAQLRRAELAVVGFSSDLRSTTGGVGPSQGSGSVSTHQALDFVGLAIPFDVSSRRLTFQLAYQRAVDLFGEGEAVVTDDVALTDLGIEEEGSAAISVGVFPQQRGAFHNVSAALAFQVTEKLFLGTALNYWMGDWTASGSRQTTLVRIDPEVGRPRPELEFSRIGTTFEQVQSMRGFNLNAGFLLKYERLSVGGVLRLPFNGEYRLDETNETTYSYSGEPSPPEYQQFGVTSRLAWPRSGGLGLALRPFTGLTLSADVSTALWSRASIDELPSGALLTETPTDAAGNPIGFTDRNFFDLLPKTVTTTSDTSQWRVGAEYLVALSRVVIPVRAGVFRSSSPFSAAHEGASAEVRGFTAGTGVNFSRFVFDVAFERRESDSPLSLRRLRSRSEEISSNPVETVVLDRVVASLILRFDTEGGVGGFFRSLFAGKEDEE